MLLILPLTTSHQEFITTVHNYDSLCNPTKPEYQHCIICSENGSSFQPLHIIEEINYANRTVLNMVTSTHCPQQQNIIDCRHFAVPMCIHIHEGKSMDQSIFKQQHIIQFRQTLPSLLEQKKKNILQETVMYIFPTFNTTQN